MGRRRLRVLLVQDTEDDALVLERELRRGGYELEGLRVDTRDATARALEERRWDLVLADHHLTGFSAEEVLELVHATGRDIPFMVVSGDLDEAAAAAFIDAGAGDFLDKDRLSRLIPAVRRELRYARIRRRRRAGERVLRKTKAQLEQVLSSTPAVIFTADPDGDFPATYVSANLEEVFGVPPSELVEGRGWLARVHPDDRASLEERLRAQVKAGGGENFYRFRNGAGEWRWVREEFRVERDAGGHPFQLTGYFLDVTERKEASNALERAEERYRALIENVADVITVLDAEGSIVYASPSALSLFGWDTEELLGRPGMDFVHPDDAERVAQRLAALTREPGSTAREVFRVVVRDGSERHVDAVGMNLSHVPSVGGIVVNTRDITERVELEARFLHSQKMEAIGQLAGGVAHDFNNLLSVIESHASQLLEEPPSEVPVLEAAEGIREATRRASDLTRQLLAVSKRQVLQPQMLSLTEAVREMEEMIRRLVPADVSVVVDLHPDAGLVSADPSQVQQVILNLVVNARDALPDGGCITLRTGRAFARGTGRAVSWLSVGDDGVGIPEEVRDRVFEPFFTTKAEGTGLGLSTVFGVVEQSGGHVELESRTGEGTTVTVLLPLVPAEGSAETRPLAAGAMPVAAGPTPSGTTPAGPTSVAAGPRPDTGRQTPDAAPPDAAGPTPDAAPPTLDAAPPTPDAAPPTPDAAGPTPSRASRRGRRPATPPAGQLGETILLVEDDPGVRQVARRILCSRGYRVLEASSAAEALELVEAAEDTPDLLLTDLVLPGMTGRELAERLRGDRPRLRVLLMSGYSQGAGAAEGELDPKLPFIQKPFSPEGLIEAVRQTLASS